MFHQRNQKTGESVDQYAQDLRKLFYKAYPRADQGSEEAEGLGLSVLAYQFVAGLIPILRAKVAGVEGSIDELLVKAKFEEAKICDLSTSSSTVTHNQRSQSRHTETSNAPRRPEPGAGHRGGHRND